jgi:hypothetical protein
MKRCDQANIIGLLCGAAALALRYGVKSGKAPVSHYHFKILYGVKSKK